MANLKKPGLRDAARITAAEAFVADKAKGATLGTLFAAAVIQTSSNVTRTIRDLFTVEGVSPVEIHLGYGLGRFTYPLPSAVQGKDLPGFAFRDGDYYANDDLNVAWAHMGQHIDNHMTNAHVEAPGKAHKGAGDPARLAKAQDLAAQYRAQSQAARTGTAGKAK